MLEETTLQIIIRVSHEKQLPEECTRKTISWNATTILTARIRTYAEPRIRQYQFRADNSSDFRITSNALEDIRAVYDSILRPNFNHATNELRISKPLVELTKMSKCHLKIQTEISYSFETTRMHRKRWMI